MIETARDMFSSRVVQAALPGLLADAATDPELGTRVLARFDGLITAVRARLSEARNEANCTLTCTPIGSSI